MAGSIQDVQWEINFLKDNYDCKVIENIGNFNYIVTIYLENKKVSIKFQLSDDYPDKPPEVVVNGLDWHYKDLEQFKARQKYSMIDFIKFIQQCIEGGRVSLEAPIVSSRKSTKKTKLKKNREEVVFENEKKASMRTAEDVIKRIKWDPSLNPADFTVGYLDRFLGVIENNFTAFNWDDLASVDYSDTAIPQHRIQYFKYKSVIVWDKTKRIDEVFGSTESGLTIKDVMQSYIEMDDSNDCGNDIDCEVEIITSFENIKNIHNRPNYFICHRLNDKKILKEIQEVQEKIVSNDESFKEFIVPQERIHLTLCTLGLHSKDDLDLACKILEENKDELMTLSSDVHLKLKNISQFFNRVVYCKVSDNENLLTLVDHMKLIMQEKGLRICDAFDFVPHVTLMKIARDESFKTIPRRIYEDYEDSDFGSFDIDELVL